MMHGPDECAFTDRLFDAIEDVAVEVVVSGRFHAR